mmetsp:Transcript_9026/g.20492  ORF Transcript_9026/g.20492 Transcript_9026/m.20492 type:complete len:213 (-) Transcript_9026:141-779(-)
MQRMVSIINEFAVASNRHLARIAVAGAEGLIISSLKCRSHVVCGGHCLREFNVERSILGGVRHGVDHCLRKILSSENRQRTEIGEQLRQAITPFVKTHISPKIKSILHNLLFLDANELVRCLLEVCVVVVVGLVRVVVVVLAIVVVVGVLVLPGPRLEEGVLWIRAIAVVIVATVLVSVATVLAVVFVATILVSVATVLAVFVNTAIFVVVR